MQKLTADDLYSLEQYAKIRPDFRARVLAHKKMRQIQIGAHVTLCFEDRLTIQYQIQEMLRIERIFEAQGIRDELDAYNPLIPDGSNWKATLLIEYEDVAERQRALARLVDLENKVWVRVHGCEAVWAIADEDMERSLAEKTAAVHFMRFELAPHMVTAARGGAGITVGVAHPHYTDESILPDAVCRVLVADLSAPEN